MGPGACLQRSCNKSSCPAEGDGQPESLRPGSRCSAGEGSDWSACRSFGFGWTDYSCASPLWEAGRSSRTRTDDGGQRCCENDVAGSVCPRGFLNVRVCEEGGAAVLDGEGKDRGCGSGDGVEGASYCQC